MKVFISWSGPRSQHIAKALHRWLPHVLQNLDPWLSTHDIDAGGRWGTDIDEALESTDYGILVLTPGHTDSPWLMFEAGALSKRLKEQSRVVPYCFGLDPVQMIARDSPLVRFQGVPADEAGTKNLVLSIAGAMRAQGEKVPEAKELEELVGDPWWPKLKAQLDATPAERAAVPEPPDTKDMVKEILDWVRGEKRPAFEDPNGTFRRAALQEARRLVVEDRQFRQRVDVLGIVTVAGQDGNEVRIQCNIDGKRVDVGVAIASPNARDAVERFGIRFLAILTARLEATPLPEIIAHSSVAIPIRAG